GVKTPLLREARVVAPDRVLAEELRELRRDALRHLPRADEDERRAMLLRERRDARVDLGPGLVRADGLERRGRDLDRDVHRAAMALVDEDAFAAGAGEEAADVLDRLLRCGEADALDGVASIASPRTVAIRRAPLRRAQRLEPLEREREMAPAL